MKDVCTPSQIVMITLRKIIEETQHSKGKYISFRTGKLVTEVANCLGQSCSQALIRYIVRHVLDTLCQVLVCTKYDTSRGFVYSFSRETLLNADINKLAELCLGTCIRLSDTSGEVP